MKDSDKKQLMEKILNVAGDAKAARGAVSVFLNQASKEEASFFLKHLDDQDAARRRIARQILGHFGVSAALPALQEEFRAMIGMLTFLPDVEHKEKIFFQQLVEISEGIFTICRTENIRDEELLLLCDDVFRRTANINLRCALIKLMAVLGDRFIFFRKIFPQLSERERRVLYFVYSFVEHPQRLRLFADGLLDDKNFDFAVNQALRFTEGRELIRNELPGMGENAKRTVLKRFLEENVTGFEDVLIGMLGNRGGQIGELAAEILKRQLAPEMVGEQFTAFLYESTNIELVKNTLEIIEYFLGNQGKDILLEAFLRQKQWKSQALIAARIVKIAKAENLSDDFSKRLLTAALPHFSEVTPAKEELYIALARLFPVLSYVNSIQALSVRKVLLEFLKVCEKALVVAVGNKITEALAHLNQVISRLTEREAGLNKIVVLLNLDPLKIDAERITKLRDQLAAVDQIDGSLRHKLSAFLWRAISQAGEDWKKKNVALELIGMYGGEADLAQLKPIEESAASLGVRVGAKKAGEKIKARLVMAADAVLILEPLLYLAKMLQDFFAAKVAKVMAVRNWAEFANLHDTAFRFIFVSDAFVGKPETDQLWTYLQRYPHTRAFILTQAGNDILDGIPCSNVEVLKKPFTTDDLARLLAP